MMQPKFSSEAWKTIRFAIREWDRTLRLLLVLVVMIGMAAASVLVYSLAWASLR